MGTDQLRELPLDAIERNPNQPRKHFDRGELGKLAASIEATDGVIQPIVVTRRESGWRIVAGERRWRACQIAGMQTVLCRILDQVDERVLAQYALLENLDRVDLTPLEIGHAYARLENEYGMRQSEIASIVGRDRTEINRYIALTRLPKRIQQYIDQGELSVGHAKALLGMPEGERVRLAIRCVKQKWSVRKLEREAKKGPTSAVSAADLGGSQRLAEQLGEKVGAAGSIRAAGKGRWVLRLDSYAPEELVGTLQKLAEVIEKHGREKGPVSLEILGPLEVFDFLAADSQSDFD